MNRRSIVATVFALVLVVGALGYALSRNGTKEAVRSTQEINKTVDPDSAEATSVAREQGVYVPYSEDAFVDQSDKTRILFFHASWCPQCRALDASIAAQDVLPANTVIYKVDYDSRQDLRQKYSVTIQTTVVLVDAAGEKVASYVAYDTPDYASIQRELFK